MKDIFFLVADSECAATVRGLLDRDEFYRTLECGEFSIDLSQDILVHPRKDPGVWKEAHKLLELRLGSYRHAVVILDEAWEGSPGADALTTEITANVRVTGWKDGDFEVIVIVPELENWIWQRNANVISAFDFTGPTQDFWKLLTEQSLELHQKSGKHRFVSVAPHKNLFPAWPLEAPKPPNPKGLVEAVSHLCNSDAASVVFNEITSRVSVKRCEDGAFLRLRKALQGWFGRPNYR